MNRPAFSMLLATVALAASLASAPRASATTPAASGVRLRRFALLIGVNDGGAARAKLRYATSDARAVARVLENLGGVAPADLVFVDTPTRSAAMDGFARVESLLRAGATPGVRRELLVYYSGHSDEEGLLLGNERVTYDELRTRIKSLPADLRVAILDSCASGAFTRGKGGVRRPPFLVDASTDMRGHAFLTSSAANEVAQESDRISASFFTYYLVSGLRGAADVNQDHRVTLQEAYQFASAETLARTERTRGGPQHAAYEFDLTGTGEMVVTDVRTTQASLVLASDLAGRITVREAGGALVAELRKTPGSTIELGVEAGSYLVSMDSGAGAIFEARATLASGEHADLSKLAFHPGKPVEVAVARGDEPAGTTTATPAPAVPNTHVGTKLGIVPREGDEHIDVDGFSFSFVGDRAGHVSGLQLALGWVESQGGIRGVQMAIGASIARGESRGLQMAEFVTWSDGSFRGVQMGGIAAVSRGETRGLQMASIVDYATGSYSGLQMAGVVDYVAGPFNGVQMAGVADYVAGPFRGLQMAGVTSVTQGEAKGVQMAGAVNVADDVTGLQLSPVNVARNQRGMQMGVVNVADEGTGFRFGVVNVARKSRGFQFGVVNVAKEADGESFALLNFIGNGIHDVAFYATDSMLTNMVFKLGGRHLYTSLGAGYQPGDSVPSGTTSLSRGDARWASIFGLGWRFGLHAGPLTALELEANGMTVYRAWGATGDAPSLDTLRLTGRVRLTSYASLLVGVGANVVVAQKGSDLDLSLGGPEAVMHSGQTTVRIYPGFLLGLQI
jgi:hypothetical protein